MAIPQVRLTGTLDNPGYPTGTPGDLLADGEVIFKLNGTMRDPTSGVVVAGTIARAPVTDGLYDITVLATDGAGVLSVPTIMTYDITLKLYVGETVIIQKYPPVAVPSAYSGVAGIGIDDLVPIFVNTGDLGSHILDSTIHNGGRELAYVESGLDSPLAANLTGIDIPGMVVNPNCSGKPITIQWSGLIYDSAANVTDTYDVWEDGARIGSLAWTLGTISNIASGEGHRTRTPAPGIHQYKLRMSSLSLGHTMHSFGNAQYPLTLSVRENA